MIPFQTRSKYNGSTGPVQTEMQAFSDASQEAIGTAVYLRLLDAEGKLSTALVFGQSKVPHFVSPVDTGGKPNGTKVWRKKNKQTRINFYNTRINYS